jgi:hypothetical protein
MHPTSSCTDEYDIKVSNAENGYTFASILRGMINWSVPDIQPFLCQLNILYHTHHGEAEHHTGQTGIDGKS